VSWRVPKTSFAPSGETMGRKAEPGALDAIHWPSGDSPRATPAIGQWGVGSIFQTLRDSRRVCPLW